MVCELMFPYIDMQKSTFPLHPAQQDVYVDQLLHVESPHYNIGGYIKLKGTLNKDKFHQAVNSAPEVFDVFKSRFDVNEPETICYFDPDYERLEMSELDFSDKNNPEKEAELWMQSRINTPFIIQRETLLFEHYLIKIAEHEHWFFGRYHHLITDGYGFIVWVQYLGRKYKSLLADDNFQFSYPSYLHEAIKANEYRNTAEYEEEARYWKDKIKEKPQNFLERKYPQNDSGKKSKSYILTLNKDQTKLLEEIQLKTKSGLQQLTIGALLIYFGKACNQSEFIFGIPVHKRSKQLRNIVGMFSGILPYKGNFQKDLKLTDFLKNISYSLKRDYRYQKHLLGDLSRDLKINSAEGHLHEVIVHYEKLNFELNFGEDIQATLLQLSGEYEKNPLQLCWQDFDNHQSLQLQIQYQNEYFSQEEIKLLALRVMFILEQFRDGLNRDIGSFDILPSMERQLLEGFNDTQVGFNNGKTIIDLFEKQVVNTPQKIAVDFEDEQLTYQQINERSNQLAHYLKSRGIREEALVPLCIERSVEMIVGIMGILKAGGAFVPIDPSYPIKRISFMIEDTGAAVAVSSKAGKSKLQAVAGLNILELDAAVSDINMQPVKNPETAVRPHHLAYVIYTSGSTGMPKGVMIEHRSVVNLVNAQSRYFNISSDERILQFSNYCFDASVEQMFLALSNGAPLILFREGLQFDINRFENFLKEKKISHLHATPYFLENLNALNDGFLKRVIAGGDVCKIDLANRWRNHVDFYNEYGPTETTVTAIGFQAGYGSPDKTISLPIGKPVANTSVYILDKNDAFCPIGVSGELHISGVQVARGYLNLAALTLERFVPDPFSNEPKARMYKTGDMGRWLPDGNIVYLGRMDDQVKIRGYRIELGEIEVALRESTLVSQGIVLAKEDKDGNRRLVAYVIADGLFDREVVTAYLKGRLPEYMVPGLWVELDSLPLTSNGKIDKKALPDPDAVISLNNKYEAPRDELEIKLAGIWQEIFQIKQIGIHDNFFELGGHSLKAIQLISRLRKQYNIATDIGKIFSHPTIRELSAVLSTKKPDQFIDIKRLPEQDDYELSHAQKRIWVLSHYKDGSIAYNVPGAYLIEGNLQVDAFRRALNMIIERHENLRTVFVETDGEPRQKIIPFSDLNFNIEEIDLREKSDGNAIINKWIENDARQAFDLSKGPLLRAALFREVLEKYILVFNIHHIISDGWSKGIIIKELLHLYKSAISGHDSNLMPLPLRYIDYAAWHTATCASQGRYWKEVYAKDIPVLDFPVDFERPKLLSFFGAILYLPVTEVLTRDLSGLATRHNMTLNNLLLALYGLLVAQYSDQEDVVIGSLVSGRSHIDLESLVGVFMNFLPVRLAPEKQLKLTDYLKNCHHTLVQAYCNQDYPFDLMVEECIKKRDISRNPFFDTMVNFHWENNLHGSVQLGEQLPDIGITMKPLPSKKEDFLQSVLDFKLDIEPMAGGLDLYLSYNSKLFTRERMNAFLFHFVELLTMAVQEPGKCLPEYFKLTDKNLNKKIEDCSLPTPVLPVNICASFTIEPLQEYLEYWNNEMELNIQLNFAPYNQVFQQLLNPNSLLNKNGGINVLFIRVEDWLRDQTHQLPAEQMDFINGTYQELIEAIGHARRITVKPFLIGIFPLSFPHSLETEAAIHIKETNHKLESAIKKIDWFHLLDFNEIASLYDVGEMYDSKSDEIGHMPFTQEYYAVLSTFLARKISAYKGPSYKVLALDCDNTLWKGVCGEVGALHVTIDDNYTYLQEFLLKKYNEGFLLALCSKNNEDDVWEVFDRHPKMKIKREHIAAHRINWQSKSDNLVGISKELNLGLDSFIFLDDSEFEVEQISLIRPEVLSIALPEDPTGFFSFLNHIWAFDHFQVTKEDGQRNNMYKAEKHRQEEQVNYASLDDFLQTLNLQVTPGSLQEKDLERAVQLTQRTNQFNLNGIRKTREELANAIRQQNTLNRIIGAKDRFGDYGIIGLLLAKEIQGTLVLESFLLSCRVLGRNVEDFVLSELRSYCVVRQLHTITALFRHTGKNKPFIEFLSRTGWVADIQTNTYSFLINYSDQQLSCTTNEKQAI